MERHYPEGDALEVGIFAGRSDEEDMREAELSAGSVHMSGDTPQDQDSEASSAGQTGADQPSDLVGSDYAPRADDATTTHKGATDSPMAHAPTDPAAIDEPLSSFSDDEVGGRKLEFAFLRASQGHIMSLTSDCGPPRRNAAIHQRSLAWYAEGQPQEHCGQRPHSLRHQERRKATSARSCHRTGYTHSFLKIAATVAAVR